MKKTCPWEREESVDLLTMFFLTFSHLFAVVLFFIFWLNPEVCSCLCLFKMLICSWSPAPPTPHNLKSFDDFHCLPNQIYWSLAWYQGPCIPGLWPLLSSFYVLHWALLNNLWFLELSLRSPCLPLLECSSLTSSSYHLQNSAQGYPVSCGLVQHPVQLGFGTLCFCLLPLLPGDTTVHGRVCGLMESCCICEVR